MMQLKFEILENTKQKFNFCNNLQIFRKILSFWVWFTNKLQDFTHNWSNSTSNKNSTTVSGADLAIRSHSSKNALIPLTSLDDFVLMILQTWGVTVVKWSRNFGFSIWKINFLQQWIKFSKWPIDDFYVNRCPEEYKEPKSKQWTQKKKQTENLFNFSRYLASSESFSSLVIGVSFCACIKQKYPSNLMSLIITAHRSVFLSLNWF